MSLLETYIHEVSPKGSPYNPWGRPGAGAPLKDEQGNVMTNTTGKLANDNMVSWYIQISQIRLDLVPPHTTQCTVA